MSETAADRDDRDYCAATLRAQDRDRYLCALLAPPRLRDGLVALYAFNLEIARTPEVVTEPLLGQIRLQWWREAIAEIYEGEPRRHQVVQPLAAAVRAHDLTRAHFETLIDAREFDLAAETPADMAALEDYAERSASPLLALALELAGERGAGAQAAARHGGIAHGLTGLLRATPHLARRNRLMLPADRIAAHHVRRSAYNALESHAAIQQVFAEVAQAAADHRAKALEHARALTPEQRRLLLPVRIAGHTLKRLSRLGHDAFDPRLEAGRFGRDLGLVLAARRGAL
jgi:phytoene synthase